MLFLRPEEICLVQASNMIWRTPEWTLRILGVAQMLVGLWLIIGLAERTAVFIATSWMLILIVLVARGNPSMLTDPYGALVKDLCLRSEEHTSELQSHSDLVCRLLLEKKKTQD